MTILTHATSTASDPVSAKAGQGQHTARSALTLAARGLPVTPVIPVALARAEQDAHRG